jgi:hypothetical protein
MGVDKYFEAEKFSCTFHDCEQSKYSVSLISDGKSIADQLIADGLAVAQVVHSRTVKTADTGEYLHITIYLYPTYLMSGIALAGLWFDSQQGSAVSLHHYVQIHSQLSQPPLFSGY